MSPSYLAAKLAAAVELYREGKISRGECFRHEVSTSLGEDCGPIVLLPEPEPANAP